MAGNPGNSVNSGNWLIGTFGFLSDVKANAVWNFLEIVEDSPLREYNLLILDHPTSAPFYCSNGEASWGGIEEGYFLTETARHLREEHGASSVSVLGVSMGGMGAIHAAYRGEGMIDSVIAFSAVTDYLDVPGDTLRELREQSAFGPAHWNLNGALNAFGLRQLIGGFNETLRRQDCPKSHVKEHELEEIFLSTPRYGSNEKGKKNDSGKKSYLELLLGPYLEDGIAAKLPGTIEEYLQYSDAARLAQLIKVPLLAVHAYDDNVVPVSHWYRFRLAARNNEKVLPLLTADGGHWGHSQAYGDSYVGCLISTYIDYWTQEKIKLREACF